MSSILMAAQFTREINGRDRGYQIKGGKMEKLLSFRSFCSAHPCVALFGSCDEDDAAVVARTGSYGKPTLINSILLFFTLKDKVLLEFDIEQQPLLLYVITLVVRFLAGVVTDLGLLIGVYFSMKALIIVNVVWKGTGAIFDIVHGATFFPLVYQQLRQLIVSTNRVRGTAPQPENGFQLST
ncbi:hypothetical protein HPB50_007358 [Hyalomma asiaticum]|uniref:Uncharacterized protein n=1 Tax=Hyalomma asiaticum TaxID=266040 RepID=A0ACB7SW14_HYAAI|nr:hypothetical protein HPB50_007358 [Hyalomma asiaticum]